MFCILPNMELIHLKYLVENDLNLFYNDIETFIFILK
jgi:hypothetical protein